MILHGKGDSGFTLVELLLTAGIFVLISLVVGAQFSKLLGIQELNREKARTLEAICVRHAVTQPLVAVGTRAISNESVTGRVDVVYPFMVFGIACETNRFVQVTNTVIQVRNDDVLQTVIMTGLGGGSKFKTNSLPVIDDLVIPVPERKSAVNTHPNSRGRVSLSYSYRVHVDGETNRVGLTIPVRMRNTPYDGYPDYND